MSQKSGKELNGHCLAKAEKHPFSCCISQVIQCAMVVIAQVAGLQMQEQKSELEAKVLEISHTREHDCLEKPPHKPKNPPASPSPHLNSSSIQVQFTQQFASRDLIAFGVCCSGDSYPWAVLG